MPTNPTKSPMPNTQTGKAQTVTGLIDPAELGTTLMHEHLLLDVSAYFDQPEEASIRAWVDAPLTFDKLGYIAARWHQNIDNTLIIDEQFATDEVHRFMLAGGNTVVDTTNIGLGRDPLALARISRRTGLNIVMGSGHYVRLFHPEDMADRDEDSIVADIVRDITVGVGDTGVKSGIIGEIALMWPHSEAEERALRAAGRAQRETGAAITLHPGFDDRSPIAILDILTKNGADLSRVVMGHLDTFHDRGLLAELAGSGCTLQWDTYGNEETLFGEVGSGSGDVLDMPSDEQRLDALEYVVGLGHEEQVLISQDVFIKCMTTAYGAKGYDHIVTNIVPRLRARGWTAGQIDQLLVGTPRRFLTLV
jgi:phosphotriesterase-related protein